jgi:hypothetical protein
MTNEEQTREQKLVKAAGKIWGWVGPGYPDLDDPDEREVFMRDVTEVAAVWFYDYGGNMPE